MRRRFLNPYVKVIPNPGANNLIVYTTTDSIKIEPKNVSFGAEYVQSTYECDEETGKCQGVLLFESDVTQIGAGAFKDITNLKTIIIPKSVTKICSNAFEGCNKLDEVTLFEGVQEIQLRAFYSTAIKSINLPNTLTSIGDYAFSSCLLQGSLHIPDSVTYLGSNCFEGGTNINSVNIGNGLTLLKSNTFKDCTYLNSVSLGSNITSIDSTSFVGCEALISLVFNQSEITNLFSLVKLDNSNFIKNLITTVQLNNTKTIGNSAFLDFTVLKELNISGTDITSIGEASFKNCTQLQKVDLSRQDKLNTINKEAFESVGSNYYKFEILLNDNIQVIGSGAFKNCTNLTNIKLPIKLQHISDYLFEKCSKLASIKLHEGISAIGEAAFMDCGALKSINIPKTLTLIHNKAFYNVGIDSIDLSDVASYLKITYDGDDCYPAVNGAIFTLNGKDITHINVPQITKIPPHAFHWKEKEECTINKITIDDEVLDVGDYAFCNFKNLINLITTENCSLKKAGKYAFANCTLKLSYADLLEFWYDEPIPILPFLDVIDEGAFENCTFEHAKLYISARTLKTKAFYNCNIKAILYDGVSGRTSSNVELNAWDIETKSVWFNQNNNIRILNSALLQEGGGNDVSIATNAFNPDTVLVLVSYLRKNYYVNTLKTWLNEDKIKGVII